MLGTCSLQLNEDADVRGWLFATTNDHFHSGRSVCGTFHIFAANIFRNTESSGFFGSGCFNDE